MVVQILKADTMKSYTLSILSQNTCSLTICLSDDYIGIEGWIISPKRLDPENFLYDMVIPKINERSRWSYLIIYTNMLYESSFIQTLIKRLSDIYLRCDVALISCR